MSQTYDIELSILLNIKQANEKIKEMNRKIEEVKPMSQDVQDLKQAMQGSDIILTNVRKGPRFQPVR